MTIRLFLLAALTIMSSWVISAETAFVARSADFYQAPAGKVLRVLPARTPVTIERREGGWYRVGITDGSVGYVRLAAVRLAEEQASESVFGGLWSWLNASRRPQSSLSTATAGVRGFDEEDLQAAQPDHEALDRLTGFASGPDSARRFAAALSLRSRQIDELRD